MKSLSLVLLFSFLTAQAHAAITVSCTKSKFSELAGRDYVLSVEYVVKGDKVTSVLIDYASAGEDGGQILYLKSKTRLSGDEIIENSVLNGVRTIEGKIIEAGMRVGTGFKIVARPSGHTQMPVILDEVSVEEFGNLVMDDMLCTKQ